MNQTRIVLVDDHALVRIGVRSLLEDEPGLEVVGEADKGDDVIPLVIHQKADVVLLDVNMPGGVDGITTARRLRNEVPQVRVYMLTMYDDIGHIEKMLAAGVHGVILKNDSSEEIIRAATYRGNVPILPSRVPAEIQKKLLERLLTRRLEDFSLLTPRETEVLSLIAQGFTNRQVSDKLHISIKTVEAHRAHIVERLGAKTKADLIQHAITLQLINVPQ